MSRPAGALDSPASWRVLVGAGIVAAFGVPTLWGSTLGLFLRPLGQELGWSRADIGFVTVLTAAAALIVVPVAGWLIDRIRLRPLVLAAVVGQAVVIAAGSRLGGSVWNFYAQVFLLMLFGVGASAMTLSKIVRGWFDVALGKAMGAMFAIVAVGGIVNPLLAQALMTRYGWRNAYLCMGAIGLVITFLVAFFLVRERVDSPVVSGSSPEASSTRPAAAVVPFKVVMSHREWWVLAAYCVLFGYAISGVGFHMPALMQDRGASPGQSALAVSLGAGGGLLGTVVAGWLIDRFSPRVMAFVVMILPICGVSMLLLSNDVTWSLAAACLLGLSTGSEGSLIAVLTGRFFATAIYGRTYASLTVAAAVGSSVAPSLTGLLQERSGNYNSALVLAIASFALAASASLLLPAKASVAKRAEGVSNFGGANA